MNRMTLDEARRRDKLIYDLAFYEVNQGMILTAMTMEGMVGLHTKVAKQFNHFKKLVKSGEYELSELESYVVLRNAARPMTTVWHSIDQIDDFVKDFDKKENEVEEDVKSGKDAFGKILKALVSGKPGIVEVSYDSFSEDCRYEDDYDDDTDEFIFE